MHPRAAGAVQSRSESCSEKDAAPALLYHRSRHAHLVLPNGRGAAGIQPYPGGHLAGPNALHSNLADLYERHADYAQAKDHYRLALDAIPPERKTNYASDAASRMLVCQLHLDNFTYSDELRCLHTEAQNLDDFSRSFQKCLFYLTLAEILIRQKDGDLSAARSAFEAASAMLHPGYEGPLTALLKRKNYTESTGATREALAFLKRISKQLH